MPQHEVALFCDNCLEDIPENVLYFEAVNRRGQRVILCRNCLYDNDFVPDYIKDDFAQCEDRNEMY